MGAASFHVSRVELSSTRPTCWIKRWRSPQPLLFQRRATRWRERFRCRIGSGLQKQEGGTKVKKQWPHTGGAHAAFFPYRNRYEFFFKRSSVEGASFLNHNHNYRLQFHNPLKANMVGCILYFSNNCSNNLCTMFKFSLGARFALSRHAQAFRLPPSVVDGPTNGQYHHLEFANYRTAFKNSCSSAFGERLGRLTPHASFTQACL